MGQELEKVEGGLLARMGKRYGVDPNKLLDTLMKTVFSDAKTKEQVIALLIVADQYKLNPFTREIYAFPEKGGGIVPVVGVDGWLRMINDKKDFDGFELAYSDERIKIGKMQNEAPEWMEVTIHHKGRAYPTVVREYLVEVYRDTDPWNKTTARMLRHKTIIQGGRVAFGFGGIYDPDEAERIMESEAPVEASVEVTIGADRWHELKALGVSHGFTEESLLATAATLGFEGQGEDMPPAIEQSIIEAIADAAGDELHAEAVAFAEAEEGKLC